MTRTDSSGQKPPAFALRHGEFRDPTPRDAVRGGVLALASRALWLTGVAQQAFRRPRVQFLYLHHVFADEEAGFRALLTDLGRDHAIISHSEALERVWSGRIDRPYVTFSFDDGLDSCARAAAILEEFGATGCFFVCPSMVGERNEAPLRAFAEQRLHVRPVRFLDWSDIERLVSRGHEIGSHTLTHANLGASSPTEVQDEIIGAMSALRERLGDVLHFAWPFGTFADMSDIAARAVFDSGAVSCASAVRGIHRGGRSFAPADVCVRRDLVIAAHPVSQTRYFMARNSLLSRRSSEGWPPGWHVRADVGAAQRR